MRYLRNTDTNKRIVIVLILGWLILSYLYLLRTPIDHRVHDIWGHVEYSAIIAEQHRLPNPKEGQETYHPPLYYIVNTVFGTKWWMSEEIKINKEEHIKRVRYLSVLYGGMVLLILAGLLQRMDIKSSQRFLILLFIITTPKFVFVFSTYNNDSLVTLLCIAVTAVSYSLYSKWRSLNAIALLLLATAGLYTKLTMLGCIFAISFILSIAGFINKRKLKSNGIKIITIFFISLLMFFPWLLIHNYKYTGKLFPTNVPEYKLSKDFTDYINSVKSVIKIPIIQYREHEWDEPWIAPLQSPGNDVGNISKNSDYFSVVFITSLIGEYTFIKPHIVFYWTLIWIHLITVFFAFREALRSDLTKISTLFILLSYIISFVYVAGIKEPIGACNMDYRYISWNLIGWIILYASVFEKNKKSIMRFFLFLLITGIINHIYILMTLK